MTDNTPRKPPAASTQEFVGADIGDPAGPTSFTDLLQQFSTDRVAAMEAIRIGFPAVLLKDTGAYFNLPPQRIRAIVRLPETGAQALHKPGALMDAAASERLWRLADVMHMARDIFEDDDAAKVWLRTPSVAFNDSAPMDYLDTEPGANTVRQALNAIASGGVL